MKVSEPTSKIIKETQTWGIWEKEPSEFSWYYDEKEVCFILEGKANVKAKEGKEISFGKGDLVEFDKGLECVWTITEHIRKRFKFGD